MKKCQKLYKWWIYGISYLFLMHKMLLSQSMFLISQKETMIWPNLFSTQLWWVLLQSCSGLIIHSMICFSFLIGVAAKLMVRWFPNNTSIFPLCFYICPCSALKFLEMVQRRITKTEQQKSYKVGLNLVFRRKVVLRYLCWGTFKAEMLTRLILILAELGRSFVSG